MGRYERPPFNDSRDLLHFQAPALSSCETFESDSGFSSQPNANQSGALQTETTEKCQHNNALSVFIGPYFARWKTQVAQQIRRRMVKMWNDKRNLVKQFEYLRFGNISDPVIREFWLQSLAKWCFRLREAIRLLRCQCLVQLIMNQYFVAYHRLEYHCLPWNL